MVAGNRTCYTQDMAHKGSQGKVWKIPIQIRFAIWGFAGYRRRGPEGNLVASIWQFHCLFKKNHLWLSRVRIIGTLPFKVRLITKRRTQKAFPPPPSPILRPLTDKRQFSKECHVWDFLNPPFTLFSIFLKSAYDSEWWDRVESNSFITSD